MHRTIDQASFLRLIAWGVVMGVFGFAGVEIASGQGSANGVRLFRVRRFGFWNRSERAPDDHLPIQQVQDAQLPDYERADDKKNSLGDPGAAPFENPSAGLTPGPGPTEQPPFERADDKEKAPEASTSPSAWTLTDLFNDDCGNNVLKDNGWKVSGYSEWGYQNSPDGSFDGNGPFLNQQGWGEFNLNQQYLYIEKIADGKKGADWGARFDVMYGSQAFQGQSFGNVNPGHWDYLNGFDHGAYNWSLPQLYGEVAMDDLSVKLGHFYTIVGYETVTAIGNFFYSRQLTFYNSEPFTHTGGLATYKADDKLSILGGWVLGFDTGFYQYQGGSAFLGGITYQIDRKTTFVYSMSAGNLGWRGDGAVNCFIFSRQWTEKLATVHQFDVFATNNTLPDGTPVSFADPASFTTRNSTSLINYLFYDLTPKWKAGLRYEWYKADGTSYNTFTYGVNYKPCTHVVIRPEVRTMWAPGNTSTYSGAHGFSGQLFNQTVFGIDAIVTF